MSDQNSDVAAVKALGGRGLGFARQVFAAVVLTVAMFARADGIALTKTDDEYVVTVESAVVSADAAVYLVWGARDAAGDMQGWEQQAGAWSRLSRRRFVPHLRGRRRPGQQRARVRRKQGRAARRLRLDGRPGPVCKHRLPRKRDWKTEVGLAINGVSDAWGSIMGGTLDQFTIGRENKNSSHLYLRYNGDDVGRAAPAWTKGAFV